MHEEAVTLLASLCDGDARTALNNLQVTVESKLKSETSKSSIPTITKEDVKENLERSFVKYDRAGRNNK